MIVPAVLGDFASSIVKVPREVITSRMQIGHDSSMHVIQQIVKRDGVRGLFRGFWSTTARDCPFMIILFGSYEGLKSRFDVSLLGSTILAGACGGVSGLVTTPLDVIKTRIMTIPTKKNVSSSGVRMAMRAMSTSAKYQMSMQIRSIYTEYSLVLSWCCAQECLVVLRVCYILSYL